MIIYTHYSDSHEDLYKNYFNDSLRKIYTKDQVKIRAAKHRQTTKDGTFMEQGWLDSMDFKLQVILKAIDENWNDYFIFADTDIVFYKEFVDDLLTEIKGFDIACQNDCESLCAGFFIARGNERVKNLFLKIRENYRNMVNDQVALNKFKNLINYKLLDKEEYYTIGNFFNNKNGTHIWDGKTKINPPNDMRMHHANYVEGVEQKKKIIEMIRSGYNK